MPFNQYRNREIQRASCLRGFGGRDFIRSAVFAAETIKETAGLKFEAGKWNVPIGSFLTLFTAKYEAIEPDPTKVKLYEKLGTNANAKQTLTQTGEEIEGTFTLTYGGQTTAAIKAKEVTGTEIVEALVKLPNVTSTNIKSTNPTKKISEEAIKFEFIGEQASKPQPLIVVNIAGMKSKESKGTVVMTTATAGTTAEKIIGVYDGPSIDFWGNEAANENLDEPVPVYFQSCTFDIGKLPQYPLYG